MTFFFGNLKDHSMNRKCSNCRISIIRHDLSMMMHAIMHVTNLIYILDEFLLRNLKDHWSATRWIQIAGLTIYHILSHGKKKKGSVYFPSPIISTIMHQFKRIVYPMITRGLNIYNKCSVRTINQNAVNYPRLINPAIIPIVPKRSINRQNLSYIRSFHISFFRLQLAPFQASSSRLDSEEEAQHSYPTAGTKDFLWSSWNRIDLSLSLCKTSNPIEHSTFPPKRSPPFTPAVKAGWQNPLSEINSLAPPAQPRSPTLERSSSNPVTLILPYYDSTGDRQLRQVGTDVYRDTLSSFHRFESRWNFYNFSPLSISISSAIEGGF